MFRNSISRLIISLQSLLLIGFVSVTGVLAFISWHDSDNASEILNATRADQLLFSAVLGVRQQISGTQTALVSQDDPTGAFARTRAIADQSFATAMAALEDVEVDGVDKYISDLQAAWAEQNRLEENIGGLQWPCPDAEHPGTEFLHENGPLVGKAEFTSIDYRPSDELADEEYPLVLSTGRILYHYNSATQTKREPGSQAKQSENFVEMHRRDARKLALWDGDPVRVISRRGTVECKVQITRRMRPGCVWMPLHFGEANTNYLTNDAGDTVTGTGEYKVCAVRLETIAS